jgi:deoxyguanosine kinase
LATYDQVHQALAERIQSPDLVVFLRASTEVAMQRIAMRDRSYERNMDYDYIDQLNQAYEDHFSKERDQKVLIIDTSPLDFVAQTAHLENVGNRIRAALGIPPFQPELPFEENDDKGS